MVLDMQQEDCMMNKFHVEELCKGFVKENKAITLMTAGKLGSGLQNLFI
jgi:hypothetical protein